MAIINKRHARCVLGQQDMYGYAAGTSAIKYPAGVAAPNVNVSMAGLPQGSGLTVDRRTSPTQAWSGTAYRVSTRYFVTNDAHLYRPSDVACCSLSIFE